MSDQDREAFNVWLEEYGHSDSESLYAAWKAARDHYWPKLTALTAVDSAAKSIAMADCGKWETLPEGDERDVHRAFTCRLYYRYLATSAFRAAGVQFRDEPNPEPGACQ